MKSPEETEDHDSIWRFFAITVPIISSVFRSSFFVLIVLAILSILLGIVPVIKSTIESGVINHFSRCIDNNSSCDLAAKVELPRSSSGGFFENLGTNLFSNLTVLESVVLYLGIVLLAFGVSFASNWTTTRIGAEIFYRLRSEGVRWGFLVDNASVADLTNAPGQYASAIQQGAASVTGTYQFLLRGMQDVFTIATVVWLLISISPKFGIFCAAIVAVEIALSLIQANRLEARRRELDLRRNELLGRSDDILSKREIILAYEKQDRYVQILDDISKGYSDVVRRLDNSGYFYAGISSIISDYGRIVVLVGAVLFVTGTAENVGDAYFFISIYLRLLSPAKNLLSRYDSIRRNAAVSRTFLGIISLGHRRSDVIEVGESTPWISGSDIRYCGVQFRYRSTDPLVLKNCSFSVPARKTTLLVGPSGCGKSTAVRLLLGFWPLSDGQIEVGGSLSTQFTPHELRLRMSYVSQNDYVVDDSLRENLLWADADESALSDAGLSTILDVVGLTEFPEGKARLDAKAKELSIGMQQRLSVARALLDTSEIVIMDEPMAGVDVKTLGELMTPLRDTVRARRQTVLIVSHRMAFAGHVDHVVVMSDHGTILEEGEPRTLLRRTGAFHALYDAARSELGLLDENKR